MGCGKSTVGKALSEVLHYDFIDLDQKMEAQKGKSIADIFEMEGEENFRLCEHQLLLEILKSKGNTIIACGGGTACFHNNMEVLNRQSATIYLQTSVDVLLENLQAQTTHRPLLKNKSGEELRGYVETILSKREPFYSQAKLIVSTENKITDEIVSEILNRVHRLES